MSISQSDWEIVANRTLRKKVCMKCGKINAWAAKRCRRCGSTELRAKSGSRGRGSNRGR